MLKKRREEGFNLAFLDVMACGLGAVLLILIIVDFNDDTPIPSDEIERLEQELAATQTQSQSLASSIQTQEQETAQEEANSTEQATKIAQLNIQQQALQQAISTQKAVIAELEDAIAAAAPLTAYDTLKLPEAGEETYLLGLIVEGKRIGILLDTSASMTDQSLIEIIKRKLSSDTQKQNGPKWQRALRIAIWMLARLPKDSQVTLASYNDQTSILGNSAVTRASNTENIEALATEINQLVPQNGTDLLQGIEAINRAMPSMTDLYIITDGLPSLISPASGFSPTRSCKPFKGQQTTISGQCRVEVFNRILRVNPLSGVKTSVILLPLEGDPQAPALYWQMANFTGGTFISPAGTWP